MTRPRNSSRIFRIFGASLSPRVWVTALAASEASQQRSSRRCSAGLKMELLQIPCLSNTRRLEMAFTVICAPILPRSHTLVAKSLWRRASVALEQGGRDYERSGSSGSLLHHRVWQAFEFVNDEDHIVEYEVQLFLREERQGIGTGRYSSTLSGVEVRFRVISHSKLTVCRKLRIVATLVISILFYLIYFNFVVTIPIAVIIGLEIYYCSLTSRRGIALIDGHSPQVHCLWVYLPVLMVSAIRLFTSVELGTHIPQPYSTLRRTQGFIHARIPALRGRITCAEGSANGNCAYRHGAFRCELTPSPCFSSFSTTTKVDADYFLESGFVIETRRPSNCFTHSLLYGKFGWGHKLPSGYHYIYCNAIIEEADVDTRLTFPSLAIDP